MMLPTPGEVERANAKRAEARSATMSGKMAEAGLDEENAEIENERRISVDRLSKSFGEIIPEGTL